MKEFVGKSGKTYKLEIIIWSAKQVKNATGFDLLNPVNDKTENMAKIADPYLESDVICELAKFSDPELSTESFFRDFGPEQLESAHDAFYKEWIDFFEKGGRRNFATAIKRQFDLIQLEMEDDEITEEAAEAIIKERETEKARLIDGLRSGKSPEELVSIQDRLPTAN